MFEIIIFFLLACIFLNTILLTLYCTMMDHRDRKIIKKRCKEVEATQIHNNIRKLKKIKSLLNNSIQIIRDNYFYGWMRYCIIKVGMIPSHRLRKLIYKHVFRMKISKDTVIYGGCEIRSPWNIKAGNCVIAVGCILDGRRGITIGDNVVFGSGVRIWTEQHSVNDPFFRVLYNDAQPVIIEDYAWICSDSTILPGRTVHKGAVIATRACVTKDCEAFSIYGGVPARKISNRNKDLVYTLNGKPHWHFY